MPLIEIEGLIAKVNKKLGAPILIRGSDLKHQTFERCTTGSVSFDVMLGGGWPLNVWNEIIGNESHGKTVMALKTIAANQVKNPDHETLWVAAEEFNSEWAETLGVNLDKITFGITNTMEEAYDIMIEALDARAVDAVVLDSYPALVPGSEDTKTMEEFSVGLGALLTNKFMRKSGKAQKRSLVAEDRDCLGIIINQWRDKIGVFMGDPRTTPGGRGKNFSYFTRVEVVRADWLERGKEKVGQVIKAQTLKNKTAPPRRIGQVDFYFSDGAAPFKKGDYDRVKEITNIAIAQDVVVQKGSFYTYGTNKWHGKDAVAAQVREDLGLQDELTDHINRLVYHIVTNTTEHQVDMTPLSTRTIARRKK